MKNSTLFLIIISGLLIVAGIVLYLNLKNIENQFLASVVQFGTFQQKEKDVFLSNFAQCLTESGVKFYGASGNDHTQNQKIIFKEGAEYLPYIECIEPETKQMTFECQVAEIKTFPTWEFPNGNRVIGETSLEKLQEISGCK